MSTLTSNIKINGAPVVVTSFSFSMDMGTDHDFEITVLLDPNRAFDATSFLRRHMQFEVEWEEAGTFRYTGLVTHIQTEARTSGTSVKITGQSPLWKLSAIPTNRSFCKQSPRAIADSLLAGISGLKVKNNLPDDFQLSYWTTFRESIGNALRRLCEHKCGAYFFFDGATLHLGLGDKKQTEQAEATLILGQDLRQVWTNAGITPLNVEINGWNPREQQAVNGASRPGQYRSSMLQSLAEAARKLFPKAEPWLFAKAASSNASARRKATREARSRAARLFSIGGRTDNPHLRPGSTIQIDPDEHGACFGDSLAGLFRVTSIDYTGDSNGQLSSTFRAVPLEATTPPPNPSVYRPTCLSMVGIVKKVKDNLVQVALPWDDSNADLPYRRVLQPQAHPDAQSHFLPVPGTQVLCMFEDGSPSKPVVLGAFYTGREKDAGQWNGKSGFKIGRVEFIVDEQTGDLTIKTGGGIVFDAARYDYE